jgi:lipoprotein-anchoring transpeptidase ErfK/SrfK
MSNVLKVVALICLWLLAGQTPSIAQGWSWADEAFGRSGQNMPRRWSGPRDFRPDVDEPRYRRQIGGDIRDGGARPEIAPKTPATVAFAHNFPANSIVINTGARKLYYVLGNGQAYEYAVSVGREGFNWTGTETISRKQAWPDWHPPAEMRERDPSLPEKMTGGLKNPLGAVALYLGTTLYRIHGTNDVKSIGRAESSGCFRMLNADVLHLASVAVIGTSVSVVPSLPAPQQVSQVPPKSAGQPVVLPASK